jgi:hypothetical protein
VKDRNRRLGNGVDDDVDRLTARQHANGLDRVGCLDVDDVGRPELRRERELVGVACQAGDDHLRRSGLGRRDRASEATLPCPENEHAVADADAARFERPAERVAERVEERRILVAQVLRHLEDARARLKHEVLGHPAPQSRRPVERRAGVRDGVRAVLLAARQALAALAAADPRLDGDAVALGDGPALRGERVDRVDAADDFVAGHERPGRHVVGQPAIPEIPVAAAEAVRDDAEDRTARRRRIRHGKVAQLELAGPEHDDRTRPHRATSPAFAASSAARYPNVIAAPIVAPAPW